MTFACSVVSIFALSTLAKCAFCKCDIEGQRTRITTVVWWRFPIGSTHTYTHSREIVASSVQYHFFVDYGNQSILVSSLDTIYLLYACMVNRAKICVIGRYFLAAAMKILDAFVGRDIASGSEFQRRVILNTGYLKLQL
jgi:hypothetical protein